MFKHVSENIQIRWRVKCCIAWDPYIPFRSLGWIVVTVLKDISSLHQKMVINSIVNLNPYVQWTNQPTGLDKNIHSWDKIEKEKFTRPNWLRYYCLLVSANLLLGYQRLYSMIPSYQVESFSCHEIAKKSSINVSCGMPWSCLQLTDRTSICKKGNNIEKKAKQALSPII